MKRRTLLQPQLSLIAAVPATKRLLAPLSIDDVRKQMFQVSAGRRLKPTSWPGGPGVGVAPVDVDTATARPSQVLDDEVTVRGEYGASVLSHRLRR